MDITALILETNDLVETEHYYAKVLEFETESKTNHSITFRVGSSTLTFEGVERACSPVHHFAFNIPSNKLNEAFTWISGKVRILRNEKESYITTFDNWRAKSIYFYDNNHNILELICREDINYLSDRKFDSKSILHISEVGIVTDNPLQLAEEFIKKTKTDFYSKGPKTSNFAVVGDEKGLLILSNPHRNWYPTERKAEKERLKVNLKIAEKQYEYTFN